MATQMSSGVNHHRHTVVMATTSYPRFPGDGVGSFIEPIAHGVARCGHDVHVVAPWHPRVRRPDREGDVRFHFFRYAPTPQMYVFGYASALRADVTLRPSVYIVTPLALLAWWWTVRRVAREHNATVVHAHWVVPGGVLAALTGLSIPTVLSLHGSDIFVAETNALARAGARHAFKHAAWTTACSEDLRQRSLALGANPALTEVVPYGVDTDRFQPNASLRADVRRQRGLEPSTPLLVGAGRLVRKKGFEYLIDAVTLLKDRWPTMRLVLAGSGDLEHELRALATSRGVADRVDFAGAVTQDDVAALLDAADVAAVPSVRDDAGNVDGLPNILLEALASGTPVVATHAGGMGAVAKDGETARVVPERDPRRLAEVIDELLRNRDQGARLGRAARSSMKDSYSWERVAARLNGAYDRVTGVTG